MLRLAASAPGGTRLRIPCPLPRIGEGGLYPQSLHKNAPAAPYKRRLIPLREAVFWLFGRGGDPTRGEARGSPRVTFSYFSS